MSKKQPKPEKSEPTGLRLWITHLFSMVEDIVYVGLGLLLAAGALTLMIGEAIDVASQISSGSIDDVILPLLDQVLLIGLRDGRWQEIDAVPTDPLAFEAFWGDGTP